MSNFPPIVLSASAGSGKTFRLSNRFIQLLLAGESPDRILATTFTRKAAGEIRSRVFSRLAAALTDEEHLLSFGRELGVKKLTRAQVLDVLERLLRGQHRLGICTNDALLIAMAQSFSLELGFSPGWRIASNDQIAKNFSRILRETLNNNPRHELLELITTLDSGGRKARFMSKLREVLANSHRIFQNSDSKAWHWLEIEPVVGEREIRARATEVAELPCAETKTRAPDKTSLNALKKAAVQLAQGEFASFLEATLVQNALSKEGFFNKKPIPEPTKVILAELCNLIVPILLRRLADSTAASYKLLKAYDSNYQGALARSGALTYDDVKLNLSRVMNLGALEEVYYRLDCRYHHLLFDEFQDTSDAEWNVLEPMVGEILSKASGEYSFFCVGDPKQAIYGWRGGRVGIFGEIPKKWSLTVESMPLSRRSAKEIISFVNRVFSNLEQIRLLQENHEAVAAWLEGFEPHDTVREEQGYVRLEVVSTSSEDGDEGSGLLGRAVEIVGDILNSAPAATIGILMRRNESVAEFISRFNSTGLDVIASEEGGNPLTDSAAVRDVLAFLLAIDSPAHSIHRFHAIQSPLGRALNLSPGLDRDEFTLLANRVREDILNRGFGAVIGEWASLLKAYAFGREVRRLCSLVELGFEFDKRRGLRLRDFVDFVEREKVEDAATSQIRVMTIHQAKGLEFDVVVVPELESYIFKSGADGFFIDELDDRGRPAKVIRKPRSVLLDFDPRLKKMQVADKARTLHDALSALYVAITRPRAALIILLPPREANHTATNLSGIITQALGFEAVSEGVLLESGDPRWCDSFKNAEVVRSHSTPPIQLNWAPESKIKELRVEAAERPSRGAVSGSKQALDAGVELHRLMEEIEWIDSGTSRIPPELEEILKFDEVKKLLSRNEKSAGVFEPRVFRELPFAFRQDSELISGRIDRLVIYERNGIAEWAEVIDFKSDQVNSDDARERANQYRKQLETYCLAASRMAGVDIAKVKRKIAFVKSGVIVEF